MCSCPFFVSPLKWYCCFFAFLFILYFNKHSAGTDAMFSPDCLTHWKIYLRAPCAKPARRTCAARDTLRRSVARELVSDAHQSRADVVVVESPKRAFGMRVKSLRAGNHSAVREPDRASKARSEPTRILSLLGQCKQATNDYDILNPNDCLNFPSALSSRVESEAAESAWPK